jgi:hypothetical protein
VNDLLDALASTVNAVLGTFESHLNRK